MVVQIAWGTERQICDGYLTVMKLFLDLSYDASMHVLIIFLNLGNSSSASMKECKCTEPCDTMKYTAYLSYGAFPGLASAKAYAKDDKKRMNELTYVKLMYFIHFFGRCVSSNNPPLDSCVRITKFCTTTENFFHAMFTLGKVFAEKFKLLLITCRLKTLFIT